MLWETSCEFKKFYTWRFAFKTAFQGLFQKIDYRTDFFKPCLSLLYDMSLPVEEFCLAQKEAMAYKFIKVKVGRIAYKEEIKNILFLMKFYSKSRFILDGNFRPQYRIIEKILRQIPCDRILYLEDICADMDFWGKISERYRVPLALEGRPQQNYDIRKIACFLMNIPQIHYFVCKPSQWGGWDDIQKWVRLCQRLSKFFVISSCYEMKMGEEYIRDFSYKLRKDIFHLWGFSTFLSQKSGEVKINYGNWRTIFEN